VKRLRPVPARRRHPEAGAGGARPSLGDAVRHAALAERRQPARRNGPGDARVLARRPRRDVRCRDGGDRWSVCVSGAPPCGWSPSGPTSWAAFPSSPRPSCCRWCSA